jgi:undecaprenyl-diphosphatase
MDGTLLGVLIGAIQGVVEWLPVSSEAGVSLALTAVGTAADRATAFALVLHLGTAVAATVYYRETIATLLWRVPDWRPSTAFGASTADLSFYGLATLASGVTGVAGYLALEEVANALAGGAFVALVGVLLLGTGALLWLGESGENGGSGTPGPSGTSGASGTSGPSGASGASGATGVAALPPDPATPKAVDAVLVGLLQGLAVLPGVSRSGTTVSALLLRGYDGPDAIRLSFVLSIPAAVGAGAIAYAETGVPDLSTGALALALLTSAAVGYASVDALTRLARRLAFSRICVGFGVLAVAGGALAMV